MWMNGYPAGQCDKEAYGYRPHCKEWHNAHSGEWMRDDGKYSGYVPGLACSCHGGPVKNDSN